MSHTPDLRLARRPAIRTVKSELLHQTAAMGLNVLPVLGDLMRRKLMKILMMSVLSIGFAAFSAQSARAQDADGDGVPDARDNCKNTPNPEIIAFAFNDDVWVWNSNLGGNPTNVTNWPGYDF